MKNELKQKIIGLLKYEYERRIKLNYIHDETYSDEEHEAYHAGRRMELRQVIRDLEELLKWVKKKKFIVNGVVLK